MNENTVLLKICHSILEEFIKDLPVQICNLDMLKSVLNKVDGWEDAVHFGKSDEELTQHYSDLLEDCESKLEEDDFVVDEDLFLDFCKLYYDLVAYDKRMFMDDCEAVYEQLSENNDMSMKMVLLAIVLRVTVRLNGT